MKQSCNGIVVPGLVVKSLAENWLSRFKTGVVAPVVVLRGFAKRHS